MCIIGIYALSAHLSCSDIYKNSFVQHQSVYCFDKVNKFSQYYETKPEYDIEIF